MKVDEWTPWIIYLTEEEWYFTVTAMDNASRIFEKGYQENKDEYFDVVTTVRACIRRLNEKTKRKKAKYEVRSGYDNSLLVSYKDLPREKFYVLNLNTYVYKACERLILCEIRERKMKGEEVPMALNTLSEKFKYAEQGAKIGSVYRYMSMKGVGR